jgi:hypothetical protein
MYSGELGLDEKHVDVRGHKRGSTISGCCLDINYSASWALGKENHPVEFSDRS